ncbi:MAG TPA: molybdopterin cofactor-binding domain-containing protein, partial [Thermoanaerobaculia bacterium]
MSSGSPASSSSRARRRRRTGEVKVRRFVAVDDCGNIINPMIV